MRYASCVIRDRFLGTGKAIDERAIQEICRLTEGHPFYTQHLCHVLWELCEPDQQVRPGMVPDALQVLLERESHAYTLLWESLTANQRRFLRGLAQEPRPCKPFSSAFTRQYDLRSASNAQRASAALVEKDVIEPDNGAYVIVDRFFRLWILEVAGY